MLLPSDELALDSLASGLRNMIIFHNRRISERKESTHDVEVRIKPEPTFRVRLGYRVGRISTNRFRTVGISRKESSREAPEPASDTKFSRIEHANISLRRGIVIILR